MSAAVERVFREVTRAWAPPPKLTVSHWAEQHRRLSRESSARDGKWITRPYQREPMDVFTDPRVHTIVLKVARQTLKTELINNCIGYVIDQDPGPMLIVQFRDTDCLKFSKIRLAPMFRDTVCLRNKVADVKSRTSGDTLGHKAFPGGHLSIVASGSPGNLAALPIRYLFCDEIDKYPVSSGAAGDPISLAQGRQEEFWNRKTVLACTPTLTGLSRIDKAYMDGDQREYGMVCQRCGEFHIPAWRHVRWSSTVPRIGRPQSARYHCPSCDTPWDDVQRWAAIKAGYYRAAAAFNGIASFWVSGLCRLGTPLAAFVEEFLSKKANPEELKTFVNEQLAETFTPNQGDAPEWKRLYERSRNEPHRLGVPPAGVLFLTAGMDVQGDRIEMVVRGWGRNKQSWVVDYRVFEGRPTEPAVWLKLTEAIQWVYVNDHRVEFLILQTAIDSGAYTQDVYDWVRRQAPGRVMAVKGMATLDNVLGTSKAQDINYNGRRIANGVHVWGVGVSQAKAELYGWLALETPTESELAEGVGYHPGYCHFSSDLAEEFFAQLVAEQLVTRMVKGYKVQEWYKIRERNEVLDTFVYARAAAAQLRMDQFAPEHWDELERRVAPENAKPADAPQPAPTRQVARSNWLNR